MDSIGGYRLVRRLGSGSRAEVWLGSGGSRGGERSPGGGSPGTVAVKVYRPQTPARSIDVELEALARASHRHLLRLDDVSTAPGGLPCLILQRLSSLSLARLLTSGPLPAGEAVTILAPLALAVAELHRVGVAHGSIRPAVVRFDADGAPVLAGFGSAVLFGEFPVPPQESSLPPALLAGQEAVIDDLDRLTALCLATLGEETGLSGWLRKAPRQDPAPFAAELADRMFALAEPRPVRFGRSATDAPPDAVPPRIGGVERSGPEPGPTPEPEVAPSVSSAIVGRFFDRIGGLLDRGSISTARARVVEVLRPVRRPVWIVAGVVAACVVAAAALLPSGESTGEPATVMGDADSGTGTGRIADVAVADAGPIDPAIAGDDPLAAATALLAARAACFATGSVQCLDGVDQAGSAALEADAYAVRMAQEGGTDSTGAGHAASGFEGATLSVVERLGDSVLLTVEPVTMSTGTGSTGTGSTGAGATTLLVIRIEAGWRIRDLVPEDASVD